MKVFLVEEMVANKEVAEEMEHYRLYRIEYGGVNADSKFTGSIWLPPEVDPDDIEKIIGGEVRRVKNQWSGKNQKLIVHVIENC